MKKHKCYTCGQNTACLCLPTYYCTICIKCYKYFDSNIYDIIKFIWDYRIDEFICFFESKVGKYTLTELLLFRRLALRDKFKCDRLDIEKCMLKKLKNLKIHQRTPIYIDDID